MSNTDFDRLHTLSYVRIVDEEERGDLLIVTYTEEGEPGEFWMAFHGSREVARGNDLDTVDVELERAGVL